jgi:phage-related minor tail protein
MTRSNTMREALVAQALEEIDVVITRIENLGESTTIWETRLQEINKQLTDSTDKYLGAITAYTEQAKIDITEHIQRRANEAVAYTVEEQRSAMQEAARLAFRSQASDDAGKLANSLRTAAKEFTHTRWARIAENAIVALASSTIALVLAKLYF